MSTKDESPSPSGPEQTRPGPRRREGWRELNAAQLVLILIGTVSAMFGLFGGLLVLLSALVHWEGVVLESMMLAAALPSLVGLVCAAGAVTFTRSRTVRRAAWQECSAAVLMALSGLLAEAIAWMIA